MPQQQPQPLQLHSQSYASDISYSSQNINLEDYELIGEDNDGDGIIVLNGNQYPGEAVIVVSAQYYNDYIGTFYFHDELTTTVEEEPKLDFEKVEDSDLISKFAVAPNPIVQKSNFIIEASAKKSASIYIYSTSGERLIKTNDYELSFGEIRIDAEDYVKGLKKGVYIAILVIDNLEHSRVTFYKP